MIILAVFLLVLTVPMTVATDAISISPTSQSAYKRETVDYTVTVRNQSESTVDATLEIVNVTGENWDWYLSENSFSIEGGAKKSVSLFVKIGEDSRGDSSTATVQFTYDGSSFTASATTKSLGARGIVFGLELTVIGMGTVFAILSLLMVLVKIIERFWGPKGKETRKEG